MFSTPDIYYYTACLLFIFTGVLCGAVRWFHLCRPYDKEADYFYPARRQVTFFYTALLLLVPYLLHLQAPDTWLFTRIFGILYYPVCFTMLYRCYFSDKDKHKHLRHNGIIAIAPFLLLLPLCGFAFAGGNRLADYRDIIMGTAGCVSILVSLRMFNTILWLKKRIDDYHNNTYSNSDDFPYKFASRVIFVPVVWMLLMWGVFLSDSREVKMWTDILLTIVQTLMLIAILHPQRNERVQNMEQATMAEIEEADEETAKEENIQISKEESIPMSDTTDEKGNAAALEKELTEKIERLFKEDRIYLNPNLTIRDVANLTGSNRSYISPLMCKLHGSFLVYVNHLRIEHALALKKENPEIRQTDLIKQSGFNTRNSYMKWLASYENSQNRQLG